MGSHQRPGNGKAAPSESPVEALGSTRYYLVIVALVVITAVCIGGVAATTGPRPPAGEGGFARFLIAGSVAAALAALGCRRLLRFRWPARIDSTGVTVRGLFRQTRIAWSQVTRVEHIARGRAGQHLGITVYRYGTQSFFARRYFYISERLHRNHDQLFDIASRHTPAAEILNGVTILR